MSSDQKGLPIEAIINEGHGGAYFRVRLASVPRVGELISLYSHLDQSTGHPANHRYEVVAVIHEIRDVTEKVPNSMAGAHTVTVFVKSSTSPRFD